MQKKLVFRFIFIYLLLVSIITPVFVNDYQTSKKKYLEEKTQKHLLEYNAIYDEHRTISNLIFDTDINTKEIINIFKNAHKADELKKNIIREELFEKLRLQYKNLKLYNLKQLHFHLPNNDSFLRMHRPNKFGDNLSDVRATVKYVNENKEYVEGFEEGRIFNGFRFVYPLFNNKEHIGSVEISFGVFSLVNTIYNTYNLNSSFLIRKDIVDKKVFKEEKKNYIDSPHEGFYFEKSVYEAFPPVSVTPNSKNLTKKILKGDAFSIYVENLGIIKTLIPIKNPISKKVVAVLCLCEKDRFITEIKNNLIVLLLITYLGFAVILFLFYVQNISNVKLKKLNEDLDKRIKLEVRKSRKKDISILKNAKMDSVAGLLNNIAHHWRQPLNVISTSASGIKIHSELNTLDEKNLTLLTESILDQSKYLSKTIESFKEYLDDNKDEKKSFNVKDKMDVALDIIDKNFEYNHIEIIKEYDQSEIMVKANVGELIQVFLNILNNAKDALIKNNAIENRKVEIKIKDRHKIVQITIEDNAGGIDESIIEKIFDPYFTTKHESIGTGISLFMCYEIITSNLKGKIYTKNKNNGAKFYIELPALI